MGEQCCEVSACLCNLLLYKLTAALLSVYLQCTQTWLSSLTSASQCHHHHHRCVISCGTNALLLANLVRLYRFRKCVQIPQMSAGYTALRLLVYSEYTALAYVVYSLYSLMYTQNKCKPRYKIGCSAVCVLIQQRSL